MDTSLMRPDSIHGQVKFVKRIIEQTVNTCIPGEIVSFDKSLQTATVKVCIKQMHVDKDGNKVTQELPQILQVPVFFPYSTMTGFSLTYPVVPGDQCLILFSQRSFDNWLAAGSVQEPFEPNCPRFFSFNDAIALVGLIPNPSAIKDFELNGVEIRNKKRTVYSLVTDNEAKTEAKTADSCASITCTVSGNIVEVATGNKTENVNGTFNTSIQGNWTIASPLMEVKGKLKASSYASSDAEGREFIGVTGAAGPLNTVTFLNGIAVAIS